ncbi:hypothetical protein JST97_14895 [bacterium]|nr:hypothetical protein [bacterium]
MSRPSELEEFLQTQLQDAQKDSSGSFTLSREKALEKLAAFQLQGAQSWLLKIVQAVVVARAEELVVRQTGTDTEFHFKLEPAWSLEQVEEAFYETEASQNLALDHLKRGLWHISIHKLRPFLLVAPGWNAGLVWTGRELRRTPVVPRATVYLAVSHRTVQEGKGIPLLRNIEAASGNAAVLSELRERAFTCAVPLKVDNRRLDALQACPGYGMGKNSYPVYLGFLTGDLPGLAVPPATLGEYRPLQSGDSTVSKVFHHQTRLPAHVGVACLITAHLRQVERNRSLVWETYHNHSSLFWVRDGVVVDRDHLGLGTGSISCALFASAEGLRSDLSGFQLARDDAYRQRTAEVIATFAPFLEQADVSLEALIATQQLNGRLACGLMMVGSLAMLFTVPVFGLFLVGGAAAAFAQAGSAARELDGALRQSLERLRLEVRRTLRKSTALPYEPRKDGPGPGQ